MPVVITAFLVMGLLANTLVILRPVSLWLCYISLLTWLTVDLFLPYSVFNALPGTGRTFVAAGFAGLPIFFSGLIFSRAFQQVSRPAEGLGANLMGAVIGGILENMVMLGGTAILATLGILLYALAAIPLALPVSGVAKIWHFRVRQQGRLNLRHHATPTFFPLPPRES